MNKTLHIQQSHRSIRSYKTDLGVRKAGRTQIAHESMEISASPRWMQASRSVR